MDWGYGTFEEGRGRERSQSLPSLPIPENPRISTFPVTPFLGGHRDSPSRSHRDIRREERLQRQLSIVQQRTFEAEARKPPVVIKLLLLGKVGVGKSALLDRFVEERFDESIASTIGVDFRSKRIQTSSGRHANLQVWDTGGQERFRSITKSYWRGAHGVLIVYCVTDMDSFQQVYSWVRELREEVGEDVPFLIVGNKIDLKTGRQISKEESVQLCRRLGLRFVETSAKMDVNVSLAFRSITEMVLSEKPNLLRVQATRRHSSLLLNFTEKKCCVLL